MQKEKLRKLRALPATKEMMEKGQKYTERWEKRWWNNKKVKKIVPEYTILARVQNLEGFIKVALFLPEKMREGIKTPRYEVFINEEGGEYITRELDDEGKEVCWRSAMMCNLDGVYISDYYKPRIYLTKDGMHTLNRIKIDCVHEYKGLQRLQRWQQEQKDKDTLRKEEREQKLWDEDMNLVPHIPAGFVEWMRKDVCDNVYIFYEFDPKGAKTGYCSRCHHEVPISNPKHNDKTRCPHCKAEANYKAKGKIQTLSTDSYCGELIQKIEDGIVVRRFSQYQYYRGTDVSEPHVCTHEFERVLMFEHGKIKKYEWGWYKNKKHRWIPDVGYDRYYDSVAIYKRNFKKLKENKIFKQSAIDLWERLPCASYKYLEYEKGNPAVEMLARIGMFRLAKGLIHERYDSKLLDQDATELAKMLKIDNARLKRLKDMGANVMMLKWMQMEKLQNTIWPDEMIREMGNAELDASHLFFLPAPVPFVKTYNYIKKQAIMMDESLNQTIRTWRDYLNMAEDLKMNTSIDQILKPKDLKHAHDELVLIKSQKGLDKQAKAIEKKWPKVNEQLPKLQKFEYASDKYIIVAPKKVLDIVTEGVVLSHCVHTCDYYFSRIQTDESYLLFLRKASHPDMPWYTLEVEPSGNIRQKRTTGDKQNKDFQDAIGFLQEWQQYFKSVLTEEEKKLGIIADEKRKENYKELRKNGNQVWHGPLAGKLLADVLEADFMAAI